MTPLGTMRMTIDPEMTRLVKSATAALQQAQLDESLDEMSARLIKSRKLCVVDRDAGDVPVVRLSPFAELVLRSAIDAARSQADSATRAKRVSQALAIGGF